MNAARLRLEFQPSPLLAAAIVASHVAAGGCLLLVLPAPAAAAIAAGLAALGMLAAHRRALLRAPTSIKALEVEGARATAFLAGGGSFEAPVAQRRYVSRFLVILFLRHRTILVTPDMLPAGSFRLLRIWALWGRVPAVAGKQLAV